MSEKTERERYLERYEAARSAAEEHLHIYPPASMEFGALPDGKFGLTVTDPLEGDKERQAAREKDIEAYNSKDEAYAGAMLYYCANFPDNCYERGLFSAMSEVQNAYIGDKRQALNKAYLAQFGKDIKTMRRRGLILCGNVGTGKTHIAAAVAQGLCMNRVNCKYVLLPSLLSRLRKAQGFGAKSAIDDVINNALDARFIVLDEFGRTNSTDTKELMWIVIDRLWTRKRSFMLITNISAKSLFGGMDTAMKSRLLDWGEVVSFEGADKRLFPSRGGGNVLSSWDAASSSDAATQGRKKTA